MRVHILPLLLLLALVSPQIELRARQDQPSQPSITSPQPGQVLQGIVPITVNTNVAGFQSAGLYFGYTSDDTHTWFLIQTSQAPITNTVMAQWDTTTITDGNYNLRLVVTQKNAPPLETILPGLRVRNYSPAETDTPAPATPTPTLEPGQAPATTATPTPVIPTATLLPTNPAELTTSDIAGSMGIAALVVLGLFVVLGFYIWVRASIRNRI